MNSTDSLSEEVLEDLAVGWLEDAGYVAYGGVEASPNGVMGLRSTYEEVLLEPRLHAAVRRLNPELPTEAVEQVVRMVSRPPESNLVQNNRWFHSLVKEGVAVEYSHVEAGVRGAYAKIIDLEDPTRNEYVVVRQLLVREGDTARRPDVVLYINGLPLVVVELKDLASQRADLWQAFEQLQEYIRTIPALFIYNELLVASDGGSTRVGSLTAGPERFSPWRARPDAGGVLSESHLEDTIRDLLSPTALIQYIRDCIFFDRGTGAEAPKKVQAGYHQFRAVRAGLDSVRTALLPSGDGRGGVVWHTQGSGKSMTMLMLAGALINDPRLANPTIVIVSDRNDLDNQLFSTFSNGQDLIRQVPVQSVDRENLVSLLDRSSGGVVFTTIQKFDRRERSVSDRANIVVLADEAHRSQYGLLKGGARWMRDLLPHATYVGFTGTPLELEDRSTRAVFGEYVDVYDVRQSVTDGATVPIYYEMRLIQLLPDEEGIASAEEVLRRTLQSDELGQDDGDITVPLEVLLDSEQRVRTLAEEVIKHLEARLEVVDGKAMAVCASRAICMDLYDAIVALRPDWHADSDEFGAVKVVMTGSAAEGDRVAMHARTKGRRESLARRFRDVNDSLKLVIVCDMWLTGFDCPPLHTMYLDKPLAGHNLMQAIARVNRVFGDKPGGVVVDFLGIADALGKAIQVYSQAGGSGTPVEALQERAVPVMLREYEALVSFFAGIDLSGFAVSNANSQMQSILEGVEHVLATPDGRPRFEALVDNASRAFALAVPRTETLQIRDGLAYFQAVRAAMRKRLGGEQRDRTPNASAVLRQLVSSTVSAPGVVDLFAAAGLPQAGLSVLSDEFLERITAIKQKNLALEALRTLLNGEIAAREQINVVQSRSFRESLQSTLQAYNNRAISAAEVLEELVSLAREIRDSVVRGEMSALSEEELAFYDALIDSGSAQGAMEDDILRGMAQELAGLIRNKATLDWTQRDAVRADLRRSVRRLLARHGYPPDSNEMATQLVMRQAELMSTRQARML
jgi:type I restriction enzyme R subunit